MKIINFGVRSEEVPVFEKLARKYKIECLTTSDRLTLENVHLVKGCQGVTDIAPQRHSPKVLAELQKYGIKYFSLRCAGYDSLNYRAGQKYGIKFARVPSYSPNAIAEFSVALALSLVRKLPLVFAKSAHHDYSLTNLIGREIRDYHVGILGTGYIGSTAARIFQGFGGKVTAYDIKPHHREYPWINYELDFDKFISQVDLLGIYIPLTPSNHHIINAETLAKMPKGSLIVNVARGGHIDSEALEQALLSGQIAGAALDVYEREKLWAEQDKSAEIIKDATFRSLQSMPNVIFTPHIAFNTTRAVHNMVEIALQNILEFCQTDGCQNQITKDRT